MTNFTILLIIFLLKYNSITFAERIVTFIYIVFFIVLMLKTKP